MKQVLNKFVATEGVLGAYVLHPEDGVVESDMPSNFGEEVLQRIGRNLTGMADLARSDFSDSREISFFFHDAALRIQGINKDYHFIALFSPRMNRGALKKAAGIFIKEFDEAIVSSRKLSLVKPAGSGRGRQTGAESAETVSPESLMSSGTLARPLETMQSALFKVVGPIAKMIFFDAIEQWLALDTPCMDSLPLLTDIVAEEVGDAGLANGFKERLPAFCLSNSPDLLSEKRKKNKNGIKVVQNM
jgi:predicted regulator of Ras-like GTPase activity (Roadblock/LC7/MglB family)